MRKLAALSAIFLTTMGLLAAAVVASAASANQGGPTLNLVAGQGSGVISMNGFIGDPAVGGTGVRVAVGTTVTWTLQSDEEHTVTFLAGRAAPAVVIPQPEDPTGRPPMFNPEFFFPTPALGPWDGTTFVSSGALQRGQQFSLTFGREGTYPYLCLFHENVMTGSVQVVAAGAAGISTQAAVDGLAATHMAAVHDRQIAQIYATRNTAGVSDGPAGTQISTVRAGTEWKGGHLDVLAFLPEDVTVRQGDTIVWYVDQNVPHTVTFVSEGATKPDFVLIQLPDGTILTPEQAGPPPPPPDPSLGPPDPSLLPRLVIGPAAVPFNAAPTFNGTGLFNSGLIGFHANEPLGSPTWALTFDAPGTYHYHCALHEQLGMVGTVTVLPAW